jgi:Tfp pilus assembly protein PilF
MFSIYSLMSRKPLRGKLQHILVHSREGGRGSKLPHRHTRLTCAGDTRWPGLKTRRKCVITSNISLRIDPTYADPLVGLADTYLIENPTTARLLASKALELDGASGEAHATLAMVAYYEDWNFPGAETEFRHALELSPNSASVRENYGVFLAQVGRFEEGMSQLRSAELLDPLNLELRTSVGLALYLARRYDDAIEQLQRVLRDDPNYCDARRHLMRIYEQRNQIPEYLAQFERAGNWFGLSPDKAGSLARQLREAFAKGGVRGFRHKQLEVLSEGSPLFLARVYAHLGERERAIAVLEKARDNHLDMLVAWLKVDPEFDNLRSEPRFESLVKRVGFP